MKQDRFGKELRCALKPGLFVLACLHAYSSSFLMSSQDPNSGGKAEAPVFFSCMGLVLVYAPRAGISTCRTTGTMSVGPGLKSVICVAEAGSGDYRIEAGLGRGAAALAVFVSVQEALLFRRSAPWGFRRRALLVCTVCMEPLNP